MDQKVEASSPSTAVAFGAGRHRAEAALTFAGYRLDVDGSLWRGGALIHLPPKELAALRLLLEHPGQIVTPIQIRKALWGEVHVTADSVPRCLSSLRARLEAEDCIQTVYKRGYRLLAEVHRHSAADAGELPRLAIVPFTTETAVPEHLGSAIAEETIFRLSNAETPQAAILARDSVFALAARGLTGQQIGEALRASLVLTGTLHAFAAHFRLRVEMVRVADGVQIWVEDLLVEKSRVAGIELELAARLEFRLKSTSLTARHSGVVSASAAGPRLERRPNPPIDSSRDASQPFSIAASAAADYAAPAVSSLDATRREAYESFLRGVSSQTPTAPPPT